MKMTISSHAATATHPSWTPAIRASEPATEVRQRVQLAKAAIVSAAATDIAKRTFVATRP